MKNIQGEVTNAGGSVEYINDIPNIPAALPVFSQVAVAGDTLYFAGQIALDAATKKLVPGGVRPETEKIFDNLQTTLTAVGLSFADIAKVSIYLTDIEQFSTMNEVYSKRMGKARPARETVAVKALALGANVEITVTAFRGKNS